MYKLEYSNTVMKKNYLVIFILMLSTSFGYAQLSDLHYLPPLKQGSNNTSVKDQAIYLSTPETTAFTLNAYIGTSTTVAATFSISNITPATYTLSDGNNDITMVTDSNTGIVLTSSGLRFESPGGEKFYVNYRGTSGSQATSLTSKGRQALGTIFKWGGAPNYATTSDISTSLGIMATEDNTVIDITGYDPDCEFRLGIDRDGITSDNIQVTLNKNESFVLEAYTNETTANKDGWLGASINSTNDIVISNGGLNYGVVSTSTGSRDAGIDQPVPENKLGKEYVFIRGNGTDSTEFPIIIGTQNNTEIYVNGATTPIATINTGDYFLVPGTNYSSTSAGANMLVTTSKDAYAYQNLAGSSEVQTVGLNFVAPLNCLLPDNMDNIPNITNAAGTTLTGGITIIASTTTPDENISVTDGTGDVTLPPSETVSGSTDWKTFYIAGLTGNVSVQSSGPIAVGFLGANSNRGIAGYFSGFDTVPEIELEVAGGGCLPGADIEIISGSYDTYQWYGDGTLIVGAIFSSYTPTTAGDYYVRVSKGTCSYDSQPISAYYCDPDLVIKKTADKTEVLEGDSVSFRITVENFGIDAITNLIVSDVMPSGFTLVSASPTLGSWTNPNWSVGTLNAGELESITIVATANELPSSTEAETFTNTAIHTQDQVDSNTTEDSPSASVTVNNDTDLDGVIDSDDLDNDNDGILDTVEATSGENIVNGNGTTLSGWNTSGNVGITSNTFNFNGGNRTPNGILSQDICLLAGENYDLNFEVIVVGNGSGTVSALVEILNGEVVISSSTYTKTSISLNTNETINFTANNNTTTIRITDTSESTASIDIRFDNISLIGYQCTDTDLNGVPDYMQLDSDDDGCTDANEAYNDSNADGGDGGEYGSGTPAVNTDGTVISASYSTPVDPNSNGTYEFQEASTPSAITAQPSDVTIFDSSDAVFSVNATDADTFQWQVSTDNGATFIDITDGTEYSGTQTNSLTVLDANLTKNNYLYRIIIDNESYVCDDTTSENALLNVNVRTVITNRKITYRVNKN